MKMSRMFFVLILGFFFGIFFLQAVAAQDSLMANILPDVKRGFFRGRVYFQDEKGGKNYLDAQTVALMVHEDGKQVLMLDKKTNEKGEFEFKNIFRDPRFQYALGTSYNDQLYVITGLSLGEDEESREIDFLVGGVSPYLVDLEELHSQGAGSSSVDVGMPSSVLLQKAPFSVEGGILYPYQKIALALCGMVLSLAAYFMLSKKWRPQ